jgi:hypothetical protein
MTTFMPAPPAATFLAFHPQDNNIIAIGMDDSTIQIYNVRIDEVFTVALFFFPLNRTQLVYGLFILCTGQKQAQGSL